jgi:hypothetical protein
MIDQGMRDPLSGDVPALRLSLWEAGEAMPRINLSLQHRQPLKEAPGGLQMAVPEAHSQVGALLRQVTRSPDHRRVRLDGVGS